VVDTEVTDASLRYRAVCTTAGRVGRWPACRLPVVGAGAALLELAPVGLTGAPTRQLEVLRRLAEVGTDPLASLLALLALVAEGS
jgi:hypothetical protein